MRKDLNQIREKIDLRFYYLSVLYCLSTVYLFYYLVLAYILLLLRYFCAFTRLLISILIMAEIQTTKCFVIVVLYFSSSPPPPLLPSISPLAIYKDRNNDIHHSHEGFSRWSYFLLNTYRGMVYTIISIFINENTEIQRGLLLFINDCDRLHSYSENTYLYKRC